MGGSQSGQFFMSQADQDFWALKSVRSVVADCIALSPVKSSIGSSNHLRRGKCRKQPHLEAIYILLASYPTTCDASLHLKAGTQNQ